MERKIENAMQTAVYVYIGLYEPEPKLLEVGCLVDYIADYLGVIKGATRSSDYSSYGVPMMRTTIVRGPECFSCAFWKLPYCRLYAWVVVR